MPEARSNETGLLSISIQNLPVSIWRNLRFQCNQKSNDLLNQRIMTPLMKQYNDIKAKHPDALLLFRVNDFYESFGQDAIKIANCLGIILTKKEDGTPLAGFPYFQLDNYLPKLVRAGNRVAICDPIDFKVKAEANV